MVGPENNHIYTHIRTHKKNNNNLLPSMAISQVVDIRLFSPRVHMMTVTPQHQPTNKGQKANTISNNACIFTVQKIFQMDDERYCNFSLQPKLSLLFSLKNQNRIHFSFQPYPIICSIYTTYFFEPILNYYH